MAQNAPAEAAGVPAGPRREVLIILPGLLLAIMLAMLDQLVVSTALPRIVGDLGGVTHLSWVVTAYVLASTVTTPLYGKLGDLYGRKRLLMAAIVIFLIGSALSGLSHTMDQLIAFRALQGLGAGGLLVGAIATIGDLVSPRERGQYMGYIMAAMTLAMVAGPLVGGYITDSLSWRWIFYINMPIGGAALAYLMATLHLPRHRVQHKIDYLGAAVLAVGAMTFLPLYQQTLQHASPTVSGLLLIPMMLGATVNSLIAGQLTVRTGKYKALPIIGGAIMTGGLLLLANLGVGTSRLTSMSFFVIFGVGMGFLMQITTLIAQNSVDPRDMGVASSSRAFFQQIGGSIGVSMFGAIFVRSLHNSLSARLPGVPLAISGNQINPASVQHLPGQVRDAVFAGISHGVDTVFLWAAPATALVFLLAWMIKEIPLRGRSDAPGTAPSTEPELVH